MRLNMISALIGALIQLTIWSTFAPAADYRPTPRPLGRELSTDSPDVAAPAEQPEGELNLRQALSLALRHNPELAAESWEVRAREAEVSQANLRPNPEFDVELEGFGGSGEFAGFDAAETTISFSQLIELGRKRSKRHASASLQQDLAGWNYEAKRLDVLTDTAKAFLSVLVAQERLAQVEELKDLMHRFYQVVSQRVASGKVSPVDQTRATVNLASAQIEEQRARLALTAARKGLTLWWGGDRPVFSRAVGSLEEVHPIPAAEIVTAYLGQNPEIARWVNEIEQRRAALELEKAEGIPDLTISLGVRNDQASDDNAFVGGFSIPLPISDRNQGGIAAARAALRQASYQRLAARNKALATLAMLYQGLEAADVEVQTLKKQILPAAMQAFEAVDLGYRAGKFGFLEVLDAQRTLFQVRGQYIDALSNYHRARIEVERLIGIPLEMLNKTPENGKNS